MPKIKTVKKANRTLPASLPAAKAPIAAPKLQKARATVLACLQAFPQTREMDDMRLFLVHETGLPMNEVDAALAALIAERQIVGTERKGWKPSTRNAWKEGVVVGSRSGTYFFDPDEGDETCGLRGTDDIPVLPGDRVLVSPTNELDRDKHVVKIEELVRRGSPTVVCRYANPAAKDGMLCAFPIDPFASSVIYVEGDKKKLEGKAFVVELFPPEEEITVWGVRQLTGRVTRIIGDVGSPDAELDIAATRFNIPVEFSSETLKEAQALPDEPPAEEAKERVDLRDLSFMTIDGEDARDFDDAVWAEKTATGWRLLVAIADVSHYVQPGHALNQDAQRRLTSVYFPRRVVPMLPEKLSNGLCSLNPGVDRCTMVCDMVVDAKGEVTAYQFYPALIHSHARQTYTAVWAALTGDATDYTERGGTQEDLEALYSLYKAFRGARERRGAIDFDTVETQIVCDPTDGHVTSIQRRDHNDAHRLVEECMLAANVCAADFIERKKAMCLYRVHDAPSEDRLTTLRATLAAFDLTLGGGEKPMAADFDKVLEAIKGEPWAPSIQLAILRTMQQAVYSPDNVGHYGLNYPHYTHFTSPIRRYPDLLVHRTIRNLLKRRKYVPEIEVDDSDLMASRAGRLLLKKQNAKDRAQSVEHTAKRPGYETWQRLGLLCSSAERRADEASRDVTAWLKCVYMQNLVGRVFDGTITGVNQGGLFVTLNDLFVEGFLHISKLGNEFFVFDAETNSIYGETSGKHYRLGDRLRVRVDAVDPDQRDIRFVSERWRDQPRRERFHDFDSDFAEDDDFNDLNEVYARSRGSRSKKKNRKATRNRK